MQKITPFLWYAKEAEEAAAFYVSIFPDSKVNYVAAMQSDSPSGPPGSVKVVDFTLFGQRFQAMTAGPHHEFNDAISITVLCSDQKELDRYWDALLAWFDHAVAEGFVAPGHRALVNLDPDLPTLLERFGWRAPA